jgi:hypothetical protein
MKPIVASELAPLRFVPSEGKTSLPYRAGSGKIGWFQSISEKEGVKFDLIIKDGLGREKYRRKNCGNMVTKQDGELINLPTIMGEELHVEVDNVRGDGAISVALN